MLSHSVVSDSLQLYGLYHTGILSVRNFPGKNTGVGCHSLLQRIFQTQGLNLGLRTAGRFFTIWASREALSESIAAAAAKSLQSCPTLCDPIDGSPPGSSVPGILQARTLKGVAISFSNAWKWKVKVKSCRRARLLATPWTAAHQAPPSKGFSRQEYWSGVPLPSHTVIFSSVSEEKSYSFFFFFLFL